MGKVLGFIGEAPSDRTLATTRAFVSPKAGMLFHEMYSYWMYVVDVTDGVVTTLESGAPCTFPDGRSIKAWRGTEEEFDQRWYYQNIYGHSRLSL